CKKLPVTTTKPTPRYYPKAQIRQDRGSRKRPDPHGNPARQSSAAPHEPRFAAPAHVQSNDSPVILPTARGYSGHGGPTAFCQSDHEKPPRGVDSPDCAVLGRDPGYDSARS